MTNTTLNQLEQIKKNGYNLDFGTVISKAIENYKKIALTVGSVILVLALLLSVFYAAIIGMFIGVGNLSGFLTQYNPNTMGITTQITIFLVTVIIGSIMAPLSAGVFKIIHLAENNKPIAFGNVFDYYKSSYLKDLIVSAIIISSTSKGFQIIVDLLMQNLGYGFLSLIPKFIAFAFQIIIIIFTLLTIPLIIFGNLSAIDAIKASITIVSKNFLIILGLIIVGFILSGIGIIGCGIGICFTMPFFYSLEYMIFKSAIIIDEPNELDEIGANDNL